MGNVFKYADEETFEDKNNSNDETSSEEFEIDASHVEKKSGNSDSSVSESTNVSGGLSSSFGRGGE